MVISISQYPIVLYNHDNSGILQNLDLHIHDNIIVYSNIPSNLGWRNNENMNLEGKF